MPKVMDPDDPEGMNMTPMIDIVFQLIIFFMLVTDMADKQLEHLKLPPATKAIKEKFADDQMLILNLRRESTDPNNPKYRRWLVMIQGQMYFSSPTSVKSGSEYNPKKLEDLFNTRRQMKSYQEVANKGDLVKYPLLIRADRSCEWQWVQMVMQIASFHGGVTRVQLGAMQEGAQEGVQ